MDCVEFIHMADGTREEYEFLARHEEAYMAGTADRVLDMLRQLDGSMGGYKVSRLGHCLQSASLAERDGAEEEMIMAALLHDIGDGLAPHNHSDFAASVLKPYVSERIHWIVQHHGVFQGYYFFHHLGGDRNLRERFAHHQWYQDCIDFCEKYDQCAFDPDYDTYPLDYFEPRVRALFAKPPFAVERV